MVTVDGPVDLDAVLPLVVEYRRRADPVLRARLKAGRRQWIRVDQCLADGTDSVPGNNVILKRQSGPRISDDARSSEKPVARAEQLAEIAVPHRQARHSGHLGFGGAVTGPFL